MELKHITPIVCPVCGARTVMESQTSLHTNGHWNESREFECGAVLRYVPNFKCLHGCSKCPNDPLVVKNRKLQEIAKKKVMDYIKKMKDVDGEFRNRLIENVYRAIAFME